MQLRLALKQHFLQKFDNLDCKNYDSVTPVLKWSLTQITDISSKKQEDAFYEMLSFEWLCTQKISGISKLKSYQVNKTTFATIRKNNYFLLLDYFTNSVLLPCSNVRLTTKQNYTALKNYLLLPESTISFTSVKIKK